MFTVAIGTIICGFFSSSFALLTYAITSLGDAISFQIVVNVMQIFGLMPLQLLSQIIAEYSLFGWPCSLIQTIYLWKYIDFKLALMFGVASSFGLFAGLELLMILQGVWLKRCVGFLILVTLIVLKILAKLNSHLPDELTPESVSTTRRMHNSSPNKNSKGEQLPLTKTRPSVFQFENISNKSNANSKHTKKYEHQKPIMIGNNRSADDVKTNDVKFNVAAAIAEEKEDYWKITGFRSLSGAVLAAVAAGFCHGLFGIGGPPFMIWILCTEINSFQFRSSISFSSSFFVHPITGYFLIIYKEQLSINHWPEYTAILVGGVFGLFLGNYLANKLDQGQFREVVQALLMIGALVLSLAGFKFDAVLIPIVVGGIFISYILYMSWVKFRVDDDVFELGKMEPDYYNTDMEME